MNPFEEFNFGDKYILRFYRVDNGLVCTINESMVPELREVAKEMSQQQAEIEALKKEKWLTEIDCKQQALKQLIDMLTIHHDTMACSSYPMSKENRR